MNNVLKSLKVGNLTNRVVQTLKTHIVKEGLKEGEKLPTERELSEILKVSRNVVREALKSLEVSGIIYKIQGKGVFVNSFQGNIAAENIFFGLNRADSNFKELIEIRKIFELTVLKLLINKITEEQIIQLQSILNSFNGHKAKDNIRVELKFHKKLLEILDNDFINRLGIIIVEFFRKIDTDIKDDINNKNNFNEKLLTNHQKIIDALRERNKTKAIKAMADHFKVYH